MRTRDRADARLIPFPTRRPIATGEHRAMHLHLVATPTGARLPAGPGADRTLTIRRVAGPASREHTTMYAANLGLNHLYAEARHHDLLAEAEQSRRLAQAARAVSRRSAVAVAVAAVRHRVGIALVRAGHRLAQGAHGTGTVKPVADGVPSIATLRCAR